MIQQLVEQGYAVVDAALPADLAQALIGTARQQIELRAHAAGIGRQTAHAVDATVRQDSICWLEPSDKTSAEFLAFMEQLRLQLNEQLYLGLFSYESHFVRYAPGAFYRKHRDSFRGARNRLVSTVYYLNPHWQPADAGELVIYRDDDTVVDKVSPLHNRLVIFLSEEFPHEVLPATRERYSIAGWFRQA
ncbi:MAG: 2OG-Fe(II) oxygenase [Pseudomonadota bacterium]